jgi:hypothetical protein
MMLHLLRLKLVYMRAVFTSPSLHTRVPSITNLEQTLQSWPEQMAVTKSIVARRGISDTLYIWYM